MFVSLPPFLSELIEEESRPTQSYNDKVDGVIQLYDLHQTRYRRLSSHPNEFSC